jgi:hypothetical protein
LKVSQKFLYELSLSPPINLNLNNFVVMIKPRKKGKKYGANSSPIYLQIAGGINS